MSEHQEVSTSPSNSSNPQPTDQKSPYPTVVYVLYLLSFITGGLTGLISVIMAYVFKNGATNLEKNHYRYVIRTFWIGLVYAIISMVLMLVLVGFLLAFLVAIWAIVRSIIGLRAYSRGEEVENVTSWFW